MSIKKQPNSSSLPKPPSPSPSPSEAVRTGLFECYRFLAPNEYSEKSVGLLAFVLRHSVGDINFSSIMDEVEKRGLEGSAADYVKLLEEKRQGLLPNDVSIEKCLMLNRLISYINERSAEFLTLVHDIRTDMRLKMAGLSSGQPVNYPADFRQRDADVNKRRNAQDSRRLFYLSHKEAKEPPSLLHLQNKTTEHSKFLLDCKMQPPSQSEGTGIAEFLNIIHSSFVITEQPHCHGIPVTICQGKKSSGHSAEIKVTIVSLLHDFIQQHPGIIELLSISVALTPAPKNCQLHEPQSISWKTCELVVSPGGSDSFERFAQKLYSFQFGINLRVNLPGYRSSTYTVDLVSLPIAIGNNTCQIPRLLAEVVLSDIRRFTPAPVFPIGKIKDMLVRLFIHQTGVLHNEHLRIFLQNGLEEAQQARARFTTMEEHFTDFLTWYLYQVRFMVKHPVLAMFYAERLFLGICDSQLVERAVLASPMGSSPVIAFRMNTIRIDYHSIANKSIVGRKIDTAKCAVRLDVLGIGGNTIVNFTLSLKNPLKDFKKLVHTSSLPKVDSVRVLSISDQNGALVPDKSFVGYNKYDDPRLNELSEPVELYRPITDLFSNLEQIGYAVPHNNVNNPQNPSTDSSTTAAVSPLPANPNQTNTISDDGLNDHDTEPMSENDMLTDGALTEQMMLDYAFTDPELRARVLREVCARYFSTDLQNPHMQTPVFDPSALSQSQHADGNFSTSSVHEQEQLPFLPSSHYQEHAQSLTMGLNAALSVCSPNTFDDLLRQNPTFDDITD